MKRFFVLAVFVAVASSSFAYYGSSSDSGFLSIILIVGGILNLILFFKIWGMTNDVKALKEGLIEQMIFSKKSKANYLRKNVVLGKIEIVKRMLLNDFIYNVEKQYWKLLKNNYKDVALKQSILPYIETLQQQYEKIGEELPSYIKTMKTFADYYNLFKPEDLMGYSPKNSEY